MTEKQEQLNEFKQRSTAATLLGISERVMARITGSVLVSPNSSAEYTKKINIGLQLKSHNVVRLFNFYPNRRKFVICFLPISFRLFLFSVHWRGSFKWLRKKHWQTICLFAKSNRFGSTISQQVSTRIRIVEWQRWKWNLNIWFWGEQQWEQRAGIPGWSAKMASRIAILENSEKTGRYNAFVVWRTRPRSESSRWFREFSSFHFLIFFSYF